MKRPSKISSNQPLLVLCAIGFLCASSGLVAAGEIGQNRLSVDFDYSKIQKTKDGKAQKIDRRQSLPSANATGKKGAANVLIGDYQDINPNPATKNMGSGGGAKAAPSKTWAARFIQGGTGGYATSKTRTSNTHRTNN